MKRATDSCLVKMFYFIFFNLQIYDGFDIHSSLIGTYCGSQMESFSSSRNSMTFQFSSDATISGKGFLLEWFALDVSPRGIDTGGFGNVWGFV